MKPILLISAIVSSLAITTLPANAGNHSYKKADGSRVNIQCTGAACVITPYSRSGKKGKVIRRAGGRANFVRLEKFYKSRGYK